MDRAMYLERARECLEMARTMREDDKPKMLKIADAWLELANDAVALDLQNGIDVSPQPAKTNRPKANLAKAKPGTSRRTPH